MILDFELAKPIVFVELKDGAVYLQDADQVTTYRMVADNLRQVALGPEQSVALIESMLT